MARPGSLLERKTGFEPATFSLARRCSTAEPLPHAPFVRRVQNYTDLRLGLSRWCDDPARRMICGFRRTVAGTQLCHLAYMGSGDFWRSGRIMDSTIASQSGDSAEQV